MQHPRRHNLFTVYDFMLDHLKTRPKLARSSFQHLTARSCADAIAEGCRLSLSHEGIHPCYDLDNDRVTIPSPLYFRTRHLFNFKRAYATALFHELIHWTGHPKRLHRPLTASFADDAYVREELVADLGAALLCHDLGMTKRPSLPHARYLNAWLADAQNPTVDMTVALSQANRAAAYILTTASRNLKGY